VHAATLRALVERVWPDKLRLVDAAIETWPLSDTERTSLAHMATESWKDATPANIVKRLSEELGVNPLSDVGEQRPLTWAALGLKWTIEYAGGIDERAVALEVAATLQIVQCELAESDLVIIPADVVLRLSAIDEAKPSVSRVPNNSENVWDVGIPRAVGDPTTLGLHVTSIAVEILFEMSALKHEEFSKLVEERMSRGMPLRTFSVRPARELMLFAEPPSIKYESLSQEAGTEMTVRPIEAPELAWPETPGPGYSWSKAEEKIKLRYERAPNTLKRTLPRLLANARCRQLIKDERARGLLDWQILTLLANVVVQWQVAKVHGTPASPDEAFAQSRLMHERLMRDESEGDPEFDLLTLDGPRLDAQRQALSMVILKSWGLENHVRTPNFLAINKLLDVRYGQSRDDVPHENPFPDI
jgi:hypothetical protein